MYMYMKLHMWPHIYNLDLSFFSLPLHVPVPLLHYYVCSSFFLVVVQRHGGGVVLETFKCPPGIVLVPVLVTGTSSETGMPTKYYYYSQS